MESDYRVLASLLTAQMRKFQSYDAKVQNLAENDGSSKDKNCEAEKRRGPTEI